MKGRVATAGKSAVRLFLEVFLEFLRKVQIYIAMVGRATQSYAIEGLEQEIEPIPPSLYRLMLK